MKEVIKMATNLQILSETIEVLYSQDAISEEVIEAFHNGELLTYAEWKKRGFQVKKGSKSPFSCKLWKKVNNKAPKANEEVAEASEAKESEEAQTPADKAKKSKGFVMTKCSFFTPSQVEKVSKK